MDRDLHTAPNFTNCVAYQAVASLREIQAYRAAFRGEKDRAQNPQYPQSTVPTGQHIQIRRITMDVSRESKSQDGEGVFRFSLPAFNISGV
jgi:hypothetical protein